ncbi:MAG: Flp pilus assembly protein CpaB [Candidatus Melainabacteria bacterium]|jgi:pilus assembly protein CpaB|nr:Flp pilus assembly protein CpaB [Candidatus Melainabacteria bacterium]
MNPMRSLFLSISRIPPAMMLLIIVGLASLITFQVSAYLNKKEAAYDDELNKMKAAQAAKGKVVYAVRDIPEGTAIPMDYLEERELEVGKIPVDSISNASLAAGRVSKFGIMSGQLLSQHDLAPQGMTLGFEARLKQGMRAITFGVDNNTGVAGFLNPESHVDVLAMVGAGAETKASPILSDIEVIAVGQTYQRQAGATTATPASSVTVAVTPEDAQKLVKAVAASKLYLSLRSDRDHQPIATVDVTSLFQKPVKASADIAQLPPPTLNFPQPPSLLGSGNPAETSAAVPPPVPPHEIEVWAASRKDVVSVPAK